MLKDDARLQGSGFFSGKGVGEGGELALKLNVRSYLIRNENKGLKKIYSDSSYSPRKQILAIQTRAWGTNNLHYESSQNNGWKVHMRFVQACQSPVLAPRLQQPLLYILIEL